MRQSSMRSPVSRLGGLIFVAALVGISLAASAQAAGPMLSVTYTTDVKGAVEPGAKVNTTITVANAASATEVAKNVMLLNTLPKGLTFLLDGTTTSNFPLGDLEPGRSKTLSFQVVVDKKAAPGTLTSLAVAKGDNTEQLTAVTPLDIKPKTKVLGATVEAAAAEEPVALAETGPAALDALLVLSGLALVSAGVVLKRRRA